MKVTELMIGDWIEDGYKKAQVTSITCDGIVETTAAISNIEVVDPIPLTEEILVKNGFEKTTDDWNRHIPLIIFESVGFPTISIHADMDMKHFWVHGTIDLTYVHQLQHLLRLAGIDKEISI